MIFYDLLCELVSYLLNPSAWYRFYSLLNFIKTFVSQKVFRIKFSGSPPKNQRMRRGTIFCKWIISLFFYLWKEKWTNQLSLNRHNYHFEHCGKKYLSQYLRNCTNYNIWTNGSGAVKDGFKNKRNPNKNFMKRAGLSIPLFYLCCLFLAKFQLLVSSSS